MIDPTELRKQIQAKIDHYLAIVATLQEKLALVGQVESLANELGLISYDHSQKGGTAPAVPAPLPEEPSSISPPTQQTSTRDVIGNGSKKLWELMHQGFQTYQAGKTDKALELFREARELNPDGFEKTWTTMISLPVYGSVARDNYFTDSIFRN